MCVFWLLFTYLVHHRVDRDLYPHPLLLHIQQLLPTAMKGMHKKMTFKYSLEY